MVFIELLDKIIERERLPPLDMVTLSLLVELEKIADENCRRKYPPEAYIEFDKMYLDFKKSEYGTALTMFVSGVRGGTLNWDKISTSPDFVLGYDSAQKFIPVLKEVRRPNADNSIVKSYRKLQNELKIIPELLIKELFDWNPQYEALQQQKLV